LITDAASDLVKELKIFLYGAVALGGFSWAGGGVDLSNVPEIFEFEPPKVGNVFEILEAFRALTTSEASTTVEDWLTAEIKLWSDAAAVPGRCDRYGALTMDEPAAGLASIKTST